MIPIEAYRSLIETLTGGQSHRVWSLLISIFGDLAIDEDQWISGTVLNRITSDIGIKPEATRVALHRLRKDGWIESRKNGRRSDYSLTQDSRKLSTDASPRIYGTIAPSPTCYLLIKNPVGPATSIESPHIHPISAEIALTINPPTDNLSFPMEPEQFPDWMRDRICSAELVENARSLFENLGKLQERLPDPDALNPIQIAVLRVLVVHSWRRIILKTPHLPDDVFPKGWKGGECRRFAHKILDQIARPTLSELEACCA